MDFAKEVGKDSAIVLGETAAAIAVLLLVGYVYGRYRIYKENKAELTTSEV